MRSQMNEAMRTHEKTLLLACAFLALVCVACSISLAVHDAWANNAESVRFSQQASQGLVHQARQPGEQLAIGSIKRAVLHVELDTAEADAEATTARLSDSKGSIESASENSSRGVSEVQSSDASEGVDSGDSLEGSPVDSWENTKYSEGATTPAGGNQSVDGAEGQEESGATSASLPRWAVGVIVAIVLMLIGAAFGFAVRRKPEDELDFME